MPPAAELPPLPIIEPFRIRTVEPVRPTTRAERLKLLEAAGWNLFSLRAEHVLIDLLTDSGTGAMSTGQWAAMMVADESYAGASSFYRFRDAVREVTGYDEVIPTHQGRAAEHLLCGALLRPGDRVFSNTLFDTTRANVEAAGAVGIDLPCAEAADSTTHHPWKGEFDLAALDAALSDRTVPTGFVMLTITNNARGGQPVRPSHAAAVREITARHAVPLFIDGARFAENAGLVRQRDPAWGAKSPAEIARALFASADGCLVSGKKDGLVNMGGFLALRDPELAARLRERLVVTEGFPTYGGLAGRDLEAMACGLQEALDPAYLRYRLASVRYLVDGLAAAGLPVAQPAGGHAAFVDARRALPHIAPLQLPAQSLAAAFYVESGVRTVEIGTLMFGAAALQDLVRLALPRRVYTQSHVDYVVASAHRMARLLPNLPGFRIVTAPPRLRHFTCVLEPLGPWPA